MSDAPSRRLSGGRTYAGVAADLVAVLADVVSAAQERLRRAADELERALPDPPDSAAAARLHRLVAGLGLSPFERDLVVVAGLPHEHETVAEVLAEIHPRGAPVATPALAAALLCRHPRERSALSQALTDGALVRAGALDVGGGPFPHRSLGLAEGLWEVLHGRESWPARLRVTVP